MLGAACRPGACCEQLVDPRPARSVQGRRSSISATLHRLTAWLLQVHNIVVGKNGTVIGEIGKRARTELELIFGVRVHLYLQVKHRSS